MDEEGWSCPHGHGVLIRNDVNGVHHTCDTCRGFAVTIWLLDELLADGAGAGIWRSAAGVAAGGEPCPVCATPMRPVAPPAPGTDAGRLEVCRACEVVWVDAMVIPLLPVHPGIAAVGAAAPDPTHCPTCGAPYDDYLSDRCRYCRSRIIRGAPDALGAPEVAELAARANTDARWPEDIVHEAIEAQSWASELG